MNRRIAFFLVLLAPALFAQADDDAFLAGALRDAGTAFRSATNAAGFAEAARQYRYLVEEEGLRNAAVFYNLGNARYLTGDLGRAILAYRRAQRYAPDRPDLLANLRVALDRRRDFIPPEPPPPLLRRLFFWHYALSLKRRAGLFALLWILLWSLLAVPRLRLRRKPRAVAALLGLVCLALLASIGADLLRRRLADPGVVLDESVVARKGDGELYAPAFLDPLHAGTEFERVEDRGDWWRIRLPDGRLCWIPAHSAATVKSF